MLSTTSLSSVCLAVFPCYALDAKEVSETGDPARISISRPLTMYFWPSNKLRTQAEGEVLRKLWKTGDATKMPESGGPFCRHKEDLFGPTC